MKYFLILLLFAAGCSYTSHTSLTIGGTKVKSVYVIGDNINAVIERTMTVKMFHK